MDLTRVSSDEAPRVASHRAAVNRPGGGWRWWRLILATVLSAGAASTWIVVALRTAGHGFDVTDEGLYLLTYRWWNTDFHTFNGAQFVYGPLFSLLGRDVEALRLARLVIVVAVHAVFGWAFLRWLRQRRPDAPATRWWEAAGTTAIVACAGMIYSWLPQTPGYNDVGLLGALLAIAVILRMGTHVDCGRPVPVWVAIALGPVAAAMLLAKWSTAILVLPLVGIVGVVLLLPRGRREVLRVLLWTIGSLAATLLLVHLALAPLTVAIPQMLESNRRIAAGSHSPFALALGYLRQGYGVLSRANAVQLLALLFTVVLVVLARRRWTRVVAGWFAAGVLVASGVRLISGDFLLGGLTNVVRFPFGAAMWPIAAVLLAAVVFIHSRRGQPWRSWPSSVSGRDRRDWLVFGLLGGLPYVQAFGTDNNIQVNAVNAYAAWAALIVAVVTGVRGSPVLARAVAVGSAAGAIAVTTLIAMDALAVHPYRTAPMAESVAEATGVAPLGTLRLEPAKARAYSNLAEVLRPYLDPPGRPIMGFDELAGIVFLLDGRSYGEAWYSSLDQARTAASIRTVCGPDGVWSGPRPILIFGRPVSDTERDALSACGLEFDRDFTRLALPEQTLGLQVYVPVEP